MSRTAQDWINYRKQAIEAREILRDASRVMSDLLGDLRFDEQHHAIANAEAKTYVAVESMNTAIGSLTGGWWDEEDN